MKRDLRKTSGFLREAKRLVKRSPQLAEAMKCTLEKLAEDAFQPSLKTHKLKGDMSEQWSCSAGYDLRVIFEFVKHEGQEVILLYSVGTHDEVY